MTDTLQIMSSGSKGLKTRRSSFMFSLPKVRRSSLTSPAESSHSGTHRRTVSDGMLLPECPRGLRSVFKDAYSGNKDAQYTVGSFYDIGKNGLPVSTESAIYWYKLAAFQGHPVAANNLGVLYSTGHQGTCPEVIDHSQAFKWFQMAAEAGLPVSLFHLGLAYMTGEGVPSSDVDKYEEKEDEQSHDARNLEKAFELFKKSAKAGYAKAQTNVGVMYMEGKGVRKDIAKAEKWLEKAQKNGDIFALISLAVIRRDGAKGTLPDREKACKLAGKAFGKKVSEEKLCSLHPLMHH